MISFENIKSIAESLDINKEVLYELPIKNKKRSFMCRCKVDNHEWSVQQCHLMPKYTKCPVCTGRAVSDYNRLSTNRPDLIKYFKNKLDSEIYSIQSNKKIDAICPNCGFEKSLRVCTLYRYGFGCNVCGDGISIPQKFITNVLEQMNIKFEPEKTFDWSQKRRYDFYLAEYNMIIEVHGMQHYKTSNPHWKIIQCNINIDTLKHDLANFNGISNYIIIDARYSDFKFLKESVESSMGEVFNISDIDWISVYRYCQTNLMYETYNLYTNGETPKQISKKLNISPVTVNSYLRKGKDSGQYEYIGGRGQNKKTVYQYTKEFELVQTFESCALAQMVSGISNISNCCLGKSSTSGGFVWRYEKINKESI